jgi:peptidoglycan-N-acetylglucosamine deacetylase
MTLLPLPATLPGPGRSWFDAARRVAGLALLLLLAFAVRAGAAPVKGDRLEALTLAMPEGERFEWRPGRVTVLSFCAFWCDTWKEQSRRLEATRKAVSGSPVDFLTLSIDGRWAERGREKVPGRLLLDPGGTLTRRLEVTTVPYTLVLDERGEVRLAAQGIVRGAELQEAVRALLNGEEPAAAPVVFLTFDDFPAGPQDEELLDLLRARKVRATFFCLGRNAEAHPDLVRRAAREGHSLQLHSWDHSAAAPQLERCVRTLERIAGTRPVLYRPPGSSEILRITSKVESFEFRVPGSERTSQKRGSPSTQPSGPPHLSTRNAQPSTAEPPRNVQPLTFTVNPFDYVRPGEKELARRVLLAAKEGAVIQLHAGVSETRRALPEIIASLRRRGMGFAALE